MNEVVRCGACGQPFDVLPLSCPTCGTPTNVVDGQLEVVRGYLQAGDLAAAADSLAEAEFRASGEGGEVYDQALADLWDRIDDQVREGKKLYDRGLRRTRAGDLEAAETDLKRAVTADGRLAGKAQRHLDALREDLEELRKRQWTADWLLGQVDLHLKQGRLQQADKDLDRVLEELDQLGAYEEQARRRHQALVLDVGAARKLAGETQAMAAASLRVGNYDQARRDAEKALQLDDALSEWHAGFLAKCEDALRQERDFKAQTLGQLEDARARLRQGRGVEAGNVLQLVKQSLAGQAKHIQDWTTKELQPLARECQERSAEVDKLVKQIEAKGARGEFESAIDDLDRLAALELARRPWVEATGEKYLEAIKVRDRELIECLERLRQARQGHSTLREIEADIACVRRSGRGREPEIAAIVGHAERLALRLRSARNIRWFAAGVLVLVGAWGVGKWHAAKDADVQAVRDAIGQASWKGQGDLDLAMSRVVSAIAAGLQGRLEEARAGNGAYTVEFLDENGFRVHEILIPRDSLVEDNGTSGGSLVAERQQQATCGSEVLRFHSWRLRRL